VFTLVLALALQAFVPVTPAGSSTDTTHARRAAADTVLRVDRFVPNVALGSMAVSVTSWALMALLK
jgi:hypothetical protein